MIFVGFAGREGAAVPVGSCQGILTDDLKLVPGNSPLQDKASRVQEWEVVETWSRRGGVDTQLCRRPNGEPCVLKSCREPASSGWLQLLNLVETLRLLASCWWTPGGGRDGFVGLRGCSQQTDLLRVELEYVPGQTLRQAVPQAHQFSEWMKRLLGLLGNLHRLGRVHGDLKPDNILLSSQGQLVVVDFGYLHETPDHSSLSLRYAAPELAAGLKVGAAADFYSLGMLWKELSADVPEWMLQRLTQVDPLCRYQSADEILHDLEAKRPGSWFFQQSPTHFPYIHRPELEHAWRGWLLGPAQGRATWTSLTAPSGMGKSRFLREISQGYRVLWGGCNPGDSPQGSGALHQALAQLKPDDLQRPLEPMVLKQLASLFPALRGLGHDFTEAGVISGLGYASRIRQLLTQLLHACSTEQRPLWLVLDDMQWVDSDTLRILQELSHQHEGSWMVTLAYRSDEWTPPPELHLDAHMALPPLNAEQAEELGQAVGAEPGLVNQAQNWSGGSPFFLLEVLRQGPQARSLVAEFSLTRHTRQWLERRLRRLPTDCRRMLSVLALQGRRFELPPLVELGYTADQVEEHVRAAEGEQILWRQGDHGVFCHDQLRESVLQLSTHEEQQGLHRRLARHWSSQKKPREFGAEYCRRLAYHLQQSPQARRALPYLLRAARHAEQHYRFGEARSFLLQTLELHSDVELELRCHRAEKALDLYSEADNRLSRISLRWPRHRSLLKGYLAQSKFEAGQYVEAIDLLQEAFAELPLPRWPTEYFRCLKSLLSPRWRLPIAEAEAYFCSQALSSVSHASYHTRFRPSLACYLYLLSRAFAGQIRPDVPSLLALVCAIMYHVGPVPLAQWISGLVQSRLDRGGNATDVALAEGQLNVLHVGSPSSPEPLQKAEKVCAQLVLAGRRWDALMAFFVQTLYRLMAGKVDRVAGDCRSWLEAARLRKDPLTGVIATHFFVVSHGEFPEQQLDGDWALPQHPGDVQFRTFQAAVAAQRAVLNGDFELALGLFRQLDHKILSLDECMASAWHATLARTAAEALPRRAGGRREQLLSEAERQVKRCFRRSKRFVYYHAQALRERALLLVLRGREKEGQAALRQALDFTLEYRMPYQQLLTRREWARCARELDWPEQVVHERECVHLCAEMKTPWLLPGRSQLLPDLKQLALEAAQALQGERRSQPLADSLLTRAPEWTAFWQSLAEQARRREQEREELQRAEALLRYSSGWLDQLWDTPLLEVAQASSRAVRPGGHTLNVDNALWSVQLQVPSPQRALVLALQSSDALAIQRRLEQLRSLTPGLEHEIDRVLGRLYPALQTLEQDFAARGMQIDRQGSPPAGMSAYEQGVLACVLRELLSNASRHSPRQPVQILWRSGPDLMELEVVNSDSGEARPGTGRGLDYVRLRLAEIGAQLDFRLEGGLASACVRLPRF